MRRAVVNSLWVSAAVTMLAVPVGTALALVVERGRVPGRRWLRVGALLPLLIPTYVSALSWSAAYGPSGVVDNAIGLRMPGLFGAFGVVAVITVNTVPLSYLTVTAALAGRAEPDLERAAKASGASTAVALATITLPLLRPALIASGVLSFVYAMNNFGVPAVLGSPAGFATATTRIYQGLVLSGSPEAFTHVLLLASVLILIALVGAAVVDAAAGGVNRTGSPAGGPGGSPGHLGGRAPGRSVGGPPRPVRGSRLAPGALAVWVFVALTSLVPLAALVLVALTRAPGLAPIPENWTRSNFAAVLDANTAAAFGRSLRLAATAATVLVPLGGLIVAVDRQRRGRPLGTLVTLSFAVPASALGVAALLAYGRWLLGSLTLILIAYLGKFWALAHRPLAGAADRLPPELYRAARVSGAGPVTAVSTVVVPLLLPAIASGWLLVFLFALHELPMSSLLYGPGTSTLSVVILNLQQLGQRQVTAALAVSLTMGILLAAAPLLLLRRPPLRRGGAG